MKDLLKSQNREALPYAICNLCHKNLLKYYGIEKNCKNCSPVDKLFDVLNKEFKKDTIK